MIYLYCMMKMIYMQNISHSSMLYVYAYKLTLVLVKMSMFELRILVEIYLQKLDSVWRTVCQAADRPSSDRGPSVASWSRQSSGKSRPSALSRAGTIRAPTRTVREWLLVSQSRHQPFYSILPHELSSLG
jgi:hypothetical protein